MITELPYTYIWLAVHSWLPGSILSTSMMLHADDDEISCFHVNSTILIYFILRLVT